MGSNHDWNTPHHEVDEGLIKALTQIIHQHVRDSGWDGWLTTIGYLVQSVPETGGDVDDWYGTFNEALKIARNRGWLDWESKGPKGRRYRATEGMAAKFLKDTRPVTPGTARVKTAIVVTCPHCNTPHEYEVELTLG